VLIEALAREGIELGVARIKSGGDLDGRILLRESISYLYAWSLHFEDIHAHTVSYR